MEFESMSEENGSLSRLSDALTGAVETAGAQILTVSGRRRGPASGVHWQPGVVVTADHVIERDENITVQVNGTKVEASLAGRDPTTDLALLKVAENALPLPAAPL